MDIQKGKWIEEKSGCESPIFKKKFNAGDVKSAVIEVCGLGWFELYINGKKVTDAMFTPAVSVYEQLGGRRLLYPLDDIFVSPRIYFCRYDISKLLSDGENVISVQLGNGWYNQKMRDCEGDFYYGKPKLLFCAVIEKNDGETMTVISDESVKCTQSGLLENNIFHGEKWDLSMADECRTANDGGYENAALAKAPGGELEEFTYPYDCVTRRITPKYLGFFNNLHVYDAGENIAGTVSFDTVSNEKITITHAEEINEDFSLNTFSAGAGQLQICEYIGDGKMHKNVHPHFSWQGFRYFAIDGRAENVVCNVVHTNLEQSGDFYCDDEVINTVLDMYKRTQLANIHGCVPSDCPHRERLGYTGDGQITCETVMHMFDAKQLYQKWMRDIADCQNKLNGHIQHTAPFAGGGGGPSGWGGAAIVVPYTYYKMYGDADFVKKYLNCMTAYLDYMESRCNDGLVTHEEKDGWCLGDWCYTGCTPADKQLAPEYVNTAYLAEFYDKMLWLDEKIGLGADRAEYEKRAMLHRKAITEGYYDSETGDFCGNYRGANVFAIDAGLGDKRTLDNLVKMYDKLGGFDTGIFATEKLVGILAETGNAQLVYKLLSSKKAEHSFYYMHERGATTLWEYWNGAKSHNHPMFGGCIKALWKCFLGIQPLEPGYKSVKISPCDIAELGDFGGYMDIGGKLSVRVKRGEFIEVEVPDGIEAVLEFKDKKVTLSHGANRIEIK